MLTLLLIILIAATIAAAYRWPDIENRLFPHEKPPKKSDHDETDAGSDQPVAEPVETTSTAKGIMQKRPIRTEPNVESGSYKAPEPAEPVAASAAGGVAETTQPGPAQGEQQPGEPGASAAVPPKPVPKHEPGPLPGGSVTGAPAVPSQPAYIDATKPVNESVAELSREADKAFQERDYVRAERACLKILLKEPRNHKYMTRIGQIYREMGNLEDAKEAFEEAKKLDPKNFFVLNQLSEVERMITDKGGRTKRPE